MYVFIDHIFDCGNTNSGKYKRRENRDAEDTSSLLGVWCSYIGQRSHGRSVVVVSITEHFLEGWRKCHDEVQRI